MLSRRNGGLVVRACLRSFPLAAILMLVAFSGVAGAYTIGSGVVWRAQVSGTTNALRDVAFVDTGEGWAVGDGGTILHTTDGGVTWVSQESGVVSDLWAVTFIDALSGWAVGRDNTIIHTTDGGATWTAPTDWGASNHWRDVDFVDASTGWVVSGFGGWGVPGVVLNTTDGGANWQVCEAPAGFVFSLEAIDFVDRRLGWAVGWEGAILHTTDGGATWAIQREDDLGGIRLKDVVFVDALNGWVVGGGSNNWGWQAVLRTADGGVTWTTVFYKGGTTFNGVAPIDADSAWVVDWFDRVLHSTDAGATWTEQPLVGAFNAITFADATSGWAVGDGGTIYHTVVAEMATPTLADTAGSPYMVAVENLADAGIATGYDDGTFRPEQPLFRAQFAKMICLALKLYVDEEMVPPFSDLGEDFGNFYPTEYVAAAALHNIVNGLRPGIFGPWDNVTRAQVVTMVVRALESEEPGRLEKPPATFRGSLRPFDSLHTENMRVAEYNHLLDGLVGFGPGWNPWTPMTRGEIAQVIWNGREGR